MDKFVEQAGAYLRYSQNCTSGPTVEKNKTTSKEERLQEEFVYQLIVAGQTVQHCDELLKAHTGDSECELAKTLKENNVDISAYQSGSISSWQPLHAHGGQRR